MAPPLAAALGGAAYFLGHLGHGCWPLLFVFQVPLWWSLERARSTPSSLSPFALGLLFGGVAFAGGFSWLWPLVDTFLDGSLLRGGLFMAAYCAWFALGFGLYGWAVARLRDAGVSLLLAVLTCWLLLEWLWPGLFEVHAGTGLIRARWLAQTADLGGPLLLSAQLVLWNAAIHALVDRSPRSAAERWPTVALGAAVLVAVSGYGVWTEAIHARGEAPSGDVLEVGVVQANLTPELEARDPTEAHRVHLALTESLLEAGPLHLVVWPETAYSQGLRHAEPLHLSPVRGPDLDEARIPLLFGAALLRIDEHGRYTTNSALLTDRNGMAHAIYDKNILIPMAETMPFEGTLSFVADWAPHAQRYRPSHRMATLDFGRYRIATPICFEIIHSDFIARFVRGRRPHLIITLANDAFFGDSMEPEIHLALARLRAIEHRLPIVRSTNSGISAFIDPAGRLQEKSGVMQQATLRGRVALRETPRMTLYGRLGDWLGWAAIGGLACLGILRTGQPALDAGARGTGEPPGASASPRAL